MFQNILKPVHLEFLEPIVLSSVLSLPLDCTAWTTVFVPNQNVIQSMVVGSMVTCLFFSDACWPKTIMQRFYPHDVQHIVSKKHYSLHLAVIKRDGHIT